jgi:Bacterial Ig domain
MKPISLMAMVISLCTMPVLYAGNVFTEISTTTDSRESLAINGEGADSWGTTTTKDGNNARVLTHFRVNADKSIAQTPYASSLIVDLKPKQGGATHGFKSLNGYVEQVWPLKSGAVLFSTDTYVQATGATSSSYLYKLNTKTGTVGNNPPQYDNQQAILNIGQRGDVQQVDMKALHHRSLLESSFNAPDGSKVLFFGEYNVGTQDHIALWKSTTSGDSWSKVIQWNTVANQTYHINGVVQNPYTQWIYILLGDVAAESAIVAWDGTSASPPDNTPLANIGKYPGWKVISGSQKLSTGDLIFTPPPNGKCIWIPEAELAAGKVLYGQRANYDLTGLESTGVVPYSKGNIPIIGVRSNTGNIFWVSYREKDAIDKKLYVWKSIDAGQSWSLTGKVNVYTNWTAVPQNLRVQGQVMESITTDYLTINGRDLDFTALANKQGSSAFVSSKTIYPKNPPETTADVVALTKGSSKVVNVVKNDLYVEETALKIMNQPSHGKVSVCCGGVKYTASPLFAGKDSFSYTLKNLAGISNPSTVTVYVIDAKTDAYTFNADRSAIQQIRVGATTGVAKNDVPNDIAGTQYTITSPIARTAGTGKATFGLQFNKWTGAYIYTLTTPVNAVTPAQKQAAKRGSYQFAYAMVVKGVKTAATKVTITIK